MTLIIILTLFGFSTDKSELIKGLYCFYELFLFLTEYENTHGLVLALSLSNLWHNSSGGG